MVGNSKLIDANYFGTAFWLVVIDKPFQENIVAAFFNNAVNNLIFVPLSSINTIMLCGNVLDVSKGTLLFL